MVVRKAPRKRSRIKPEENDTDENRSETKIKNNDSKYNDSKHNDKVDLKIILREKLKNMQNERRKVRRGDD